jgi:hypothetical protein
MSGLEPAVKRPARVACGSSCVFARLAWLSGVKYGEDVVSCIYPGDSVA